MQQKNVFNIKRKSPFLRNISAKIMVKGQYIVQNVWEIFQNSNNPYIVYLLYFYLN